MARLLTSTLPCLALVAGLVVFLGCCASPGESLRNLKEETCGASHPAVGFSGPIMTRQHELGGVLTIVDDCTFKVENFSHDGVAPAVYWWGNDSTGTSTAELRTGAKIVAGMVPYGDGTGVHTGTLLPGYNWDNVKIIYGWCELFDINFGEVILSQQ